MGSKVTDLKIKMDFDGSEPIGYNDPVQSSRHHSAGAVRDWSTVHQTSSGRHNYHAAQAARVEAIIRRVSQKMGARLVQSTRGAARPVICLDKIDPQTGQPQKFRSVSEAAEDARVSRCHHIRRACLGGRSRGRRYAYADPVTPHEGATTATST